MDKYTQKGITKIVYLVGVRVEGKRDLQFLTEHHFLAKCDSEGNDPQLGKVVEVCFRKDGGRRKFVELNLPYNSWVALGRPSLLQSQDQRVYTPLLTEKE